MPFVSLPFLSLVLVLWHPAVPTSSVDADDDDDDADGDDDDDDDDDDNDNGGDKVNE